MGYQTHQWMDTEMHVVDLFGASLKPQLVPDGYNLRVLPSDERIWEYICNKITCRKEQWKLLSTGYCHKHSLKRDSLWKRFNKWRKTL